MCDPLDNRIAVKSSHDTLAPVTLMECRVQGKAAPMEKFYTMIVRTKTADTPDIDPIGSAKLLADWFGDEFDEDYEVVIVPQPDAHTCETCGRPATDCYRECRGTGHSEHVCACKDHAEFAL